jgi:transcriptional regulator with XRE-family HTH domain
MTTKERLISVIDHLRLNPSQFEKNVGLSNGYVNNIRRSIGPESVDKILKVYPQFNKAWLLLEEGTMLKPQLTDDDKLHVFEEDPEPKKVFISSNSTDHRLASVLLKIAEDLKELAGIVHENANKKPVAPPIAQGNSALSGVRRVQKGNKENTGTSGTGA